MKRIVKKFSDFSYIKEDIQNMGEIPSDVDGESSEDVQDTPIGEVEESPLSQISEETGIAIDQDDKGEFIKTEDGDVIRYYSETGYYNETTKKKYGESVTDVINSLQSAPVSESKKHTCRSGCGCTK